MCDDCTEVKFVNFEYFIDIVGACNLRCPSCPTGNFKKNDFIGLKRPTGFMSIDLFQSIVRKISENQNPKDTNLHLYNWGEPLLHPKIYDIIKISSEAGFNLYISSNLNTSKDLSKILDYRIKCFRISNSGYYQNNYETTHVNGNINLVKSNMYKLRYLIDIKKSDVEIELFYHMYKGNLNDNYKQMKRLCNELQYKFRPIIANFVNVEKVIKILNGEPNSADKKILDNLLFSIDESIEINNINNDSRCELYENQMVINFDGTVALCCGVFDPEYFLEKNILSSNFKELQKQKEKFKSLCKNCTQKGIHKSLTYKNEAKLKKRFIEVYKNCI